jgi:MYXO-CTERM domain-containing protein
MPTPVALDTATANPTALFILAALGLIGLFLLWAARRRRSPPAA